MSYYTSVFTDTVITPWDLPLFGGTLIYEYHSFYYIGWNKKHDINTIKFKIHYSLTLEKFSGIRATNLL